MVEELARSGVRHAVLSPGSRSTPLAVALHREPAIDLTVIVDERSAGFFALGAAQATRTPVAILCTSGTAAANLHPAVAEADESAVPLIVLTADRPPELRGIGAGQTIDQIKLYGAAVRWFCEVGNHEADDEGLLHYRYAACRAFAAARGDSRPGPVHLNVPWREPLAPVAADDAVTAGDPLALEGRDERPLTAVATGPPEPNEFILSELARHISGASRGLIIAGRQTDPGLREPLAALSAAALFPVLAEPTSQLRSGPHDRSHVITTYDSLLRTGAFDAEPPDLVLRFGEMPTSKRLRAWLASSGADQLIVDAAGGWNEPTRRAAAMLRVDPAALATGLAERVERGSSDWVSRWTESEWKAHHAMEEAIAGLGEVTEPGLQFALAGLYSDGDLVYTNSSMPVRDQEVFLPPGPADVRFLANRGANGIDGLISSAAGAAHATGMPTVAITGELGLLHDLGGLAAAAGAGAPVRVVVIDNGGGGIFHFLPQREAMDDAEFDELLATPRGVDAGKAAELFGIPHRRVTHLGELGKALGDETCLIEVRTDRHGGPKLRQSLHDAVARAVSDA
jgi:2-succinyl-5-enolpyruvyl-6-hydroxy-3-cyclohexene-1-carboxylate synthase